jgi:hypothetical protein
MNSFNCYYHLSHGDSPSLLEVIVVDRLVISPEPFIQKCRRLATAKSFFLEVANGRIRLAWKGSSDDGNIEFMERRDTIGLGISYDMLLDALSEAGGSIEVNGHYHINDAIRQKLRSLRTGDGRQNSL